ncbi:MAG: DUF2273 domain-containing protein [Clostridiales bacterium]|nr:DUF2273 domain-containing protein [Clostridiales bacterium]
MEDWVRALFKRGTPQCGVAYGLIAFVFSLLLIFVGFWKTVLVVVICAAAVFLGANRNYEQAIKNGINKVLPENKNHSFKSSSTDQEDDTTEENNQDQQESH